MLARICGSMRSTFDHRRGNIIRDADDILAVTLDSDLIDDAFEERFDGEEVPDSW